MKTAIATFGIIVGIFAINASADEVLSPKARELRGNALRGGTEVRQTMTFARGKAASAPNVVLTNGSTDRNLVAEQRAIIYTGKNPLRNTQSFEIAPVK